MIQFFITYWKKGLNIGRNNQLHYLQRQQTSILNAILILVIISVLFVTAIYYSFDYQYKNIALLPIPICFLSIWLNVKYKYKIAKNVAYIGILAVVTVWCYFERRTGVHYLYITLGCGVASIFNNKKAIFATMAICALFFKAYVYWDYVTPFVPIQGLDYKLHDFLIIYLSAALIFFQIMVNLDISRSISKSNDNRLNEKVSAINKLEFVEEKLKESNHNLLSFNSKLDKLVRKSSEELYSFQAAIDDNLFSLVTDLDGKITKINDNYLQKTGFSKHEIVGKNITELQSDIHTNSFYAAITKTIYAGKVWRGESKIKTKTGRDFWLVSSILPIKTNSGVVKSFLTIAADITEKKLAQEKEKNASTNLEKSENKLALILQSLPDLISILDVNGNRKYVNDSYCEFFGKEAHEFIGSNYIDQKPENISKNYIRLFKSLDADNPQISYLDVIPNAKGEKRWFIWKEMALFDTNNNLEEVFCIGHDITEIKEIEFQNANFIAQFEEIAFKTSHNFRGPLTSIMGLINILEDDGFEENEIKQVGHYMKTAINNLDIASRELAAFIEKYNNQKNDNRSVYTIYDFEGAKTKHLNWKFKLRNFLDGTGSLTTQEAISHQHCELGRWYYSEGKAIYGHLPAMIEFEIEHEKLHNIVKEIIDLKSENQTIQSEQKYHDLLESSDKIILLLDQVETEVSKYVLIN